MDPHRLVGLAHVAGLGVGIGVDGHRPHAQPGKRGAHAYGDLAAVGDQD